jgi:hypothetical protein
MKLINIKRIIVVLPLIVYLCYAGSNEMAVVTIDYNAYTKEIESCKEVQSDRMTVALRVENAKDLDGFSFKISYDTLSLRFLACNPVIKDLDEKLFLKSMGGKVGPELIQQKSGSIEIVSSLIGSSKEKAPDGSGILALLLFEKTGYNTCELYISNVELVDSNRNMDKKE